MPVSVTIYDLPDEVHDELSVRAARAGQSLEEYVPARLVELVSRPSPAGLWDRVEQRVRVTGTRLPAADVLELRRRART